MSSIKDLKSMCANTPCRDCILLSWCESRDRISELPDDMDEIVDAYVRNHPPKRLILWISLKSSQMQGHIKEFQRFASVIFTQN